MAKHARHAAAHAADRAHRKRRKLRRRVLDHIEEKLRTLRLLRDEEILLVKQYRAELLPAVLLAHCNIDHLIHLCGEKVMMRATTELLRPWARRLAISRAARRRIKPRAMPLPPEEAPVLDDELTAIPVAADAQPRGGAAHE